MKVLLQRVTRASVTVDGDEIARIDQGLTAFVGVRAGDGDSQADWLADKTAGLRVFPGGGKPMNVSVADVGGSVLVVSQFTLVADTAKGKRPGFSAAAEPAEAAPLVARFADRLATLGIGVASGRFGADMRVELVNDGPATFILERGP